jgi:uncharacterized protein (TIGR03435 family)
VARTSLSTVIGLFFLTQELWQVNLWPAGAQRFEVASVKVAAPLSGGTGLLTRRLDPQQVVYRHATIKMLMMDAWNVKHYQIRGPAWLDDAFYDIAAKFPDGAGPSALPEMLKALLVERFSLHMHEEISQESGYALILDKSGPKLQKSKAVEVPTDRAGLPSIIALQEARRAEKL